MTKLYVLAALGAVSAEQWLGIPPIGMQFAPVDGSVNQAPAKHAKKHYKKEDQLDDMEMMRQMYYSMYNGLVKGMFHDQRKHPVSEKCLGTWMQGSFDNAYKMVDHFADGNWHLLSRNLAIDTMTDMVNLFYKNVDYCEFEAIPATYQAWCLNNMEACSMEPDVFGNLQTNAIPLMSKGLDIFNFMMSDDLMSDKDSVKAIERVTEDVTSIAASIIGFEGKWDSSAKLMSDKEYNKLYKVKYSEMRKRQKDARQAKKESHEQEMPLSTDQFAAIFGGIGPQITGFLNL